jgi:hypothetical protein
VRIRVENLIFKPNIPAGMNPLVLMSLTHRLRSDLGDPEPIKVKREGELYRVLDGRHRAIAAIVAGRHDVLAELDETVAEKRPAGFSA